MESIIKSAFDFFFIKILTTMTYFIIFIFELIASLISGKYQHIPNHRDSLKLKLIFFFNILSDHSKVSAFLRTFWFMI